MLIKGFASYVQTYEHNLYEDDDDVYKHKLSYTNKISFVHKQRILGVFCVIQRKKSAYSEF